MIREERFDQLVKFIRKNGRSDYEALASLLNVSPDTIRRDVDTLAHNGLLVKVRGGAMIPSKNPLSFAQRKSFHTGGKDIIGLKAQQFITEGCTIFMDGGTTNCAVASRIAAGVHCRIITNNLAMVPLLANKPDIELILTGGSYDRENETAVGDLTISVLGNFVADVYFFGTCAIHATFGVTATHEHEAAVKRAMFRNSKKTIALANNEKLGSIDSFRICAIEDLTAIISDELPDSNRLDEYRDQGPMII